MKYPDRISVATLTFGLNNTLTPIQMLEHHARVAHVTRVYGVTAGSQARGPQSSRK